MGTGLSSPDLIKLAVKLSEEAKKCKDKPSMYARPQDIAALTKAILGE